MFENGGRLGAPAPVPELRPRRLLRFVERTNHATKHFHATKHPIVKSFEPGEDWAWCYIDEVDLDADELPPRA